MRGRGGSVVYVPRFTGPACVLQRKQPNTSPSPHGVLDALVPTVALRDTLNGFDYQDPYNQTHGRHRSLVTSSSPPTDTLTSLTHCVIMHVTQCRQRQTETHAHRDTNTHTHTQDGDTGLIYLRGHPGSSWVRAFTLLAAR